MPALFLDVAHVLAGSLVLVSFMLLYQDRMFGLLNVFALHAVILSASVAWQGYIQAAPHLFVTALIALGLKAIIIPVALRRMVLRLGIHRTIETVVGIGPTMLAGMGLVALSMVVMLKAAAGADPLAREDLAFALSVVLLGLMMMVTRRNAVSQIIGFMSLENGLILAATGAKGMPLVVEISVAFSVLVAFIVIGVFLFRIRERFELGRRGGARRIPGGTAVSTFLAGLPLEPLTAILAIPAGAAILLVLLPGYWLSARLNVLAAFLTFLAALSLLVERPAPSGYLFVDDLNITFVVLGTFVGFTTSAFSASYIGHELDTGHLTPRYLRFYHAMYQTLMFAMNLGLIANNIGLMWVAIELATLTTVLMVGIYRTEAAIEAAWKYFILGSVGIALALFGTILVYMAARPVLGEGHDAMVWTALIEKAGGLAPELLNVAFVFLMLGYGTKVGLAPLHAWLPDAHAEGPTPDLGRAVGAAAQRRALCAAALQDADGGQPCRHRARTADGDAGAAVADLRRLHAVPPARHQAHVRLFLDRAHGAHHLRLRHGRAARQLRRAAAHDHALAHQVGDLLRRRARRPGQGHAAHVGDARADREPSGAGLGPGAGRDGDRRPAAARHLHERVPDRHLHLRARAAGWRSCWCSAC